MIGLAERSVVTGPGERSLVTGPVEPSSASGSLFQRRLGAVRAPGARLPLTRDASDSRLLVQLESGLPAEPESSGGRTGVSAARRGEIAASHRVG